MSESVSGTANQAVSNESPQTESQGSEKTLNSARRFTFILLIAALTIWV